MLLKLITFIILTGGRFLTYIILASFLWDIGKQNSPRYDAAKRGIPSGAILFSEMLIIHKWYKNNKNYSRCPQK